MILMYSLVTIIYLFSSYIRKFSEVYAQKQSYASSVSLLI